VILTGVPSWESKFIRRALEEDPRLEVLTLWQKPDGSLEVVTPQNAQGEPSNLQSLLKEAPSPDTLWNNLSLVNLLILNNLKTTNRGGHAPDLNPDRIHRLSDWVTEGGGNLLVLGGEEMFASGGALCSQMEPFLPVQLQKEKDYRIQSVFPKLTDSGGRSEALAALRQVGLSSLGPLENYHLFGQPKLGAEVLLESEPGRPLLAWHTIGLGRVMVFGTGSSWIYGLPMAEAKIPPEFFGNFWRELARFLLVGRRGSGVRLYTDGHRYHRDEQVRVWAYLDKSLMTETSQPRVPINLILQGEGKPEILYLSQNPQNLTLYEGTFKPQQIGSWTLRLQLDRFADEKAIEVTAPLEEYRRLNQNVALLQEVAKRSGGRYLTPGEFERIDEQIGRASCRERV